MAYVGTKRLFEQAGFTKAADTTSVLNGFPRVLMRSICADQTISEWCSVAWAAET